MRCGLVERAAHRRHVVSVAADRQQSVGIAVRDAVEAWSNNGTFFRLYMKSRTARPPCSRKRGRGRPPSPGHRLRAVVDGDAEPRENAFIDAAYVCDRIHAPMPCVTSR